MADPGDVRDELDGVLAAAASEARAFLAVIDDEPVKPPGAETALPAPATPLPADGSGAPEAVAELAALCRTSALRSAGPRFFHFVMGGGTPAALAADWLTSAIDQVAFAWVSSPLAARLEQISVGWLRELFELPADFAGVLTSGATMANFTGLAAARNWWGEQHGIDVERDGLAAAPRVPVFSSGYLHPSAVEALGLLGIGRDARIVARDGAGRLDVDGLESELAALGGAPSILIGNAGEVNTGGFDPLDALADLAERHGAWLHVDGAFGLFARVAPAAAPLAKGVERAHSVIADCHKWLNVPYDCGVAFVREPGRLAAVFAAGAPYLPATDDPRPSFGYLAPENSRRARSLAVWATLRAYGRAGHRAMVERHLAFARRLAARVEQEAELELLAEPRLNIVCFRWRPVDAEEAELDELNRELGEALLEDGRVYAGTTVYDGKVAFRPAIVNWRTREEDVDLLVDVLLELGPGIGVAV
jgi:glutamate/tyrosine decarboxylase-like PLP-dependent enzyme